MLMKNIGKPLNAGKWKKSPKRPDGVQVKYGHKAINDMKKGDVGWFRQVVVGLSEEQVRKDKNPYPLQGEFPSVIKGCNRGD